MEQSIKINTQKKEGISLATKRRLGTIFLAIHLGLPIQSVETKVPTPTPYPRREIVFSHDCIVNDTVVKKGEMLNSFGSTCLGGAEEMYIKMDNYAGKPTLVKNDDNIPLEWSTNGKTTIANGEEFQVNCNNKAKDAHNCEFTLYTSDKTLKVPTVIKQTLPKLERNCNEPIDIYDFQKPELPICDTVSEILPDGLNTTITVSGDEIDIRRTEIISATRVEINYTGEKISSGWIKWSNGKSVFTWKQGFAIVEYTNIINSKQIHTEIILGLVGVIASGLVLRKIFLNTKKSIVKLKDDLKSPLLKKKK
ncbi:MAG: hypothetical protein WCK31_00810 [bacterium]